MKVVCKSPVASLAGEPLFCVGSEYPVIAQSKYKNGAEYLTVKDEQGCLRELFHKEREFKKKFALKEDE